MSYLVWKCKVGLKTSGSHAYLDIFVNAEDKRCVIDHLVRKYSRKHVSIAKLGIALDPIKSIASYIKSSHTTLA